MVGSGKSFRVMLISRQMYTRTTFDDYHPLPSNNHYCNIPPNGTKPRKFISLELNGLFQVSSE